MNNNHNIYMMMKNNIKQALILTLLLGAVSPMMAQVRETTTYDDGSYYTGERDGKGRRHGNGLMVFANGDRYEGDWKKGDIEGEGTFTYATAGYSYTGHFKKGVVQGHGTFRFNNGNVMEGDWTSMGTGTGYLLFADGTRYDGPFVNGAPQGKGVKIWSNGDRYDGDFVQGHMSGQGSLVFANGETYKGSWVNDRRQGQGNSTYPDGAHYEGNWLNDQFHGQGTYTTPDGEVMSGNWINGQLQEQ